MCAPGCVEYVSSRFSRRALFKAAGAAAVVLAPGAAALAPRAGAARSYPPFSRIIDLTHTLSPEFPTYEGVPGVALKPLKTFKADGYNLTEWTLLEHSGTHLDAPLHFSAHGAGPEAIPAEQLAAPLAVIDVSARADADPDYRLTPGDVLAWEKAHGPLPAGCCVAMNAGWERRLGSAAFAGRDAAGALHFPGFHPETAAFLLAERQVAGLAVDTLSLDHGPSADFGTHTAWLPSGRWGLENVANLGALPPRGATIIVGAPKIKGATGGPARVFALL